MDERAPTRRRFYYSINEVQLLMRCAAQLQRNATASILGVLGLLSSAPELWRFSFFVICFALGQLRLCYTAVAMTGTGLEEYVFTVGPPRGNSNQELLLP